MIRAFLESMMGIEAKIPATKIVNKKALVTTKLNPKKCLSNRSIHIIDTNINGMSRLYRIK